MASHQFLSLLFQPILVILTPCHSMCRGYPSRSGACANYETVRYLSTLMTILSEVLYRQQSYYSASGSCLAVCVALPAG